MPFFKSIFLAVVLFAFGYTSPTLAQTPANNGRMLVLVNGEEVDPGTIKHQVFCLDGEDEFELIYEPPAGKAGEQYRIEGLGLWAQLELGSPSLLASLPATKSSEQPYYKFRLVDFLPDGLSTSGLKVELIRASFSPGRVLGQLASGQTRELSLPEANRHFSFIMMVKCEKP